MFSRLRVVGLLLWSFIFLAAQDIDSVPSVQKRNLASIADEIADSAERSAFLQLFKPAAPAEMRARAEAFQARFPQSAFLAQAYEVAARGCFDLGEYELGLSYAQKSLVLLPENPLLLVPVADVEARQHLNSAAIAHASEALDDLDRFAGPASVRDEDWPNVKQQLKSTANFAKGRAQLQAALTQPMGETRRELLKNSEIDALVRALRGEFIEQMVGPKNYQLLKAVKQAWDPQHIFNPNKIVDTPPMNTMPMLIATLTASAPIINIRLRLACPTSFTAASCSSADSLGGAPLPRACKS